MFVSTPIEKMRALIANEPRTYREALAEALRRFRPRLEVNAVEPDALDAEVGRFHPHLVVCSRDCAAAKNGTLTWVTLYPDGENLAEIVTIGGRAMIVGIRFCDLLSVVDGTEFVRRSSQEDGPEACDSVGKTIEKENL